MSPATPIQGHAGLVPDRDRYLDLLRGVALFRVLAYHALDAVWLSWVFPAMGVMFAVAGSLTARSLLARPAPSMLRSRSRRLLVPLWVYSATVLLAYGLAGWRPLADGVGWGQLALWFIPIGDPPLPADVDFFGVLGEGWAEIPQVILWYIRTYFWFVLLSPLLLAAFRRAPRLSLLVPIGVTVALNVGGMPLPDWAANPVRDFFTYASCWLLGFAHRLGHLQRAGRPVVATLAVVAMALGMCWALLNLGADSFDLNDFPLGQALWSLGFTAILMRVSPSWRALPGPLAPLDPLVTLVSNRALTIYLWHYPLTLFAFAVVDMWAQDPFVSGWLPWLVNDTWTVLLLNLFFVGVVMVAVGWVEDVAARRPVRLWPDGRAGVGRPALDGWLHAALAAAVLAAVVVWWYSSYFWEMPAGWAAARFTTTMLAVLAFTAIAVEARFDPRRLAGASALIVTLLLAHGVAGRMSGVSDRWLPLRERVAQMAGEQGFSALLPAEPPLRLDAGIAPVELAGPDALVVAYDTFTLTQTPVAEALSPEELEGFLGIDEGARVVVDEWEELELHGAAALAVEWRDASSGSRSPHRTLVVQVDEVVASLRAGPQGEPPRTGSTLTFDELEVVAESLRPVRA